MTLCCTLILSARRGTPPPFLFLFHCQLSIIYLSLKPYYLLNTQRFPRNPPIHSWRKLRLPLSVHPQHPFHQSSSNLLAKSTREMLQNSVQILSLTTNFSLLPLHPSSLVPTPPTQIYPRVGSNPSSSLAAKGDLTMLSQCPQEWTHTLLIRT